MSIYSLTSDGISDEVSVLVEKTLDVVAKFEEGESAPEKRLSNIFGWLGEDDRLSLLLVSGSLLICIFLFCRDLVVGGIEKLVSEEVSVLCLLENTLRSRKEFVCNCGGEP